MATWEKIPPPAGFTAQEQDYFNKTNFTLEQMSELLGEGGAQSKETQDILKQMSGLYKSFEVSPEQTVAATKKNTFKFNAEKGQAFENLLVGEKLKEMDINGLMARNPQVGREKIAGVRKGVHEAVDQIRNSPNLLHDPEFMKKFGATPVTPEQLFDTEITDTPEQKIAAKYDTQLDPVAVQALRDKISAQRDYETKINDQANTIIQDILNPEPTDYEKRQDEVGNLELDRYEKALKGELPVSDATKAQKQQEFNLMKEGLSRRGADIYGDTPESAVGMSTSAVQSLGEFNRNWGLREDAEKRGERASGAPVALSRYGLTSDLQGRQFDQARSVQTDPGAMSLGLLGTSNQYGPMNLFNQYGSLLGGYGAAAQPFADQRNLQAQIDAQKAANKAQKKAGKMNLLGNLVGLAGMVGMGLMPGGIGLPGRVAAGGLNMGKKLNLTSYNNFSSLD